MGYGISNDTDLDGFIGHMRENGTDKFGIVSSFLNRNPQLLGTGKNDPMENPSNWAKIAEVLRAAVEGDPEFAFENVSATAECMLSQKAAERFSYHLKTSLELEPAAHAAIFGDDGERKAAIGKIRALAVDGFSADSQYNQFVAASLLAHKVCDHISSGGGGMQSRFDEALETVNAGIAAYSRQVVDSFTMASSKSKVPSGPAI